MPTYYFKLNNLPVADDGEDLPNLEAAKALALKVTRELTRNRRLAEYQNDFLQILDPSGTELFRISFRDVGSPTQELNTAFKRYR